MPKVKVFPRYYYDDKEMMLTILIKGQDQPWTQQMMDEVVAVIRLAVENG